jgi:hypothetical protein
MNKKVASERQHIIIYPDASTDAYATHSAMVEDAAHVANNSKKKDGEGVTVIAKVIGTVDADGRIELFPATWGGHADPEFIALSEMIGRYQRDLDTEKQRRKSIEKRLATAVATIRAAAEELEDGSLPF